MIKSKNEKQCPRKRVSIIHTIAVREKSIFYANRIIDSPDKAAELGQLLVKNADREHLLICCLDTKNQPVSMEVAAIGTATQCVVGMKEVFKNAILSNTQAIIIYHNHPSGHTEPSKEDILITKKIRESGQILGIDVLDHIILSGDDEYTSMAELHKWSVWTA